MNVDAIRVRFPALARREGGEPVAYFDGPGGTQVPQSVADAVADYLLHHNANTHWAYPSSRETDAIIQQARQAGADLLGGQPGEVSFGANMTTLTFHVARGLARAWHAGDEVIVTDLDHHANVAPWEAVACERGLVLRRAPLAGSRVALDLDALADLIGPRTRCVAVGAASNALGTVTDVARVAALARAAGALTYVDAVHYAPHLPVDAHAWGVDFVACSAYKFHGPHVGLLWTRPEVAGAIDVPRLAPAPQLPPERCETGTLNHEGLAGTIAAVEFLADLGGSGGSRRERLLRGMGAAHARGLALVRGLWEGLAAIPGVQCVGVAPGESRTPTVAFAVAGVPSAAVAESLAARGVFVSHGDFYAATVVDQLGYGRDGLVRAGCACYTTEEEVRRLVEGVAAIAA